MVVNSEHLLNNSKIAYQQIIYLMKRYPRVSNQLLLNVKFNTVIKQIIATVMVIVQIYIKQDSGTLLIPHVHVLQI